VLQMLGPSGVVDQNVIKKHKHKPAEVGAEHIIHQRLEGGGGVGESEHHDQEFDVAMVRPKCHFGNVLRVHLHLVVTTAKVELGEVLRPLELIQELVDDQDWKLVLHGLGVEGAIVNAKSPCMIFLADKQDQCGERRRARPNDALVEHVVALLLDLILQRLRVPVGPDSNQWRRRQQMDAVIERPWRRQACGIGEDIRELS
jgi:hypothetical protein